MREGGGVAERPPLFKKFSSLENIFTILLKN